MLIDPHAIAKMAVPTANRREYANWLPCPQRWWRPVPLVLQQSQAHPARLPSESPSALSPQATQGRPRLELLAEVWWGGSFIWSLGLLPLRAPGRRGGRPGWGTPLQCVNFMHRPVKPCMCPSILNDSFTEYSNLGYRFLLFITLNISCYSLWPANIKIYIMCVCVCVVLGHFFLSLYCCGYYRCPSTLLLHCPSTWFLPCPRPSPPYCLSLSNLYMHDVKPVAHPSVLSSLWDSSVLYFHSSDLFYSFVRFFFIYFAFLDSIVMYLLPFCCSYFLSPFSSS